MLDTQPGCFPGTLFGSSTAAAAPTMATVSRDALSGWYCPANAAEWDQALLVAGITSGGPALLWLLQESGAGNVADSIGSFTGTVTGDVTKQSAVSGWTRKGVLFATATLGHIRSTAAGLPDIATGDALMLSYVWTPPAQSAASTIQQLGTTYDNDACTQTDDSLHMVGKSGSSVVGSATLLDSSVHPIVTKLNRTGSVARMYSDQEKLSPTVTGTGKMVSLGGDNVTSFLPPAMKVLYTAVFTGAAARMSDATVKVLLQTLTPLTIAFS